MTLSVSVPQATVSGPPSRTSMVSAPSSVATVSVPPPPVTLLGCALPTSVSPNRVPTMLAMFCSVSLPSPPVAVPATRSTVSAEADRE